MGPAIVTAQVYAPGAGRTAPPILSIPMNGPALRIILLVLLSIFLFPGPAVHPAQVNQEEIELCNSRCASFSGEGRYRCLKICISSTRKRQSPGKMTWESRYAKCENSCNMHVGVDKTKCIRMCMEKPDGIDPQKDAEPPAAPTDPCRSRCGILSGADREKCIAKCEHTISPKYRDPLRFRRE